MKRVEKKSIMVWTFEDLQYYFIRLIILTAAFYFFQEYEFVIKAVILIMLYYAVRMIVDLVSNPLRYRHYRYMIDQSYAYIYSGGLMISKETIPMHRVQHVSIEQSLYSRIYGFYSLKIYTAGLNHYIEYLSESDAEDLKNHITRMILDEDLSNHED